ncbi:MAG: hypothetical protein OXC10_02280 [Rhodospirillaceae bacterium]|nr:hypothetical protein [Rhodospirillaceae bacterium]
MTPLIAAMSGTPAKIQESQNGMKYKTICRSCNSLLGSEYDPSIISFTSTVTSYINTPLALPPDPQCSVRVQRLMKGVLGHLLAAEVGCPSYAIASSDVRKYVLDPSEPLPETVNLFFWLHDYRGSAVILDLTKYSLRDRSLHRLDVLKYFPIGFLATASRAYDGLPGLSHYRNAGCDEEISLPVPLGVRRLPNWPEAPSDYDGTVTLVGEAAANAVIAHSAT